MSEAIMNVLRDCGILPDLDGVTYTGIAAELIAQDPDRSLSDIYRETAGMCRKSSSCVERSIRTVVEKAFEQHTSEYVQLFGDRKLTNKQFLYAVVEKTGVKRTKTAPEAKEPAPEPSGIGISTAGISSAVQKLIQEDNQKADKLITAYPVNIPVSAAADFLGIDAASMRTAIENGVVGLAWRKTGKANHGYYIPTAHFLRWYLRIGG